MDGKWFFSGGENPCNPHWDDYHLSLITHGTDSMSLTAESLTGLSNKTIVLTGALAPARFRVTDAVFNLGLALGAVQSLPPGVYLAMNGTIFPAGKVRKNREAGRFEAV